MIKEIKTICKNKLDNADLYIKLDENSDEIILYFIVAGSLEKIQFKCNGILSLKLIKDFKETKQCYFVGETKVDLLENKEKIMQLTDMKMDEQSLPEKLFKIEISGDIEIDIICTFLKWESLGHIKTDKQTAQRIK